MFQVKVLFELIFHSWLLKNPSQLSGSEKQLNVLWAEKVVEVHSDLRVCEENVLPAHDEVVVHAEDRVRLDQLGR